MPPFKRMRIVNTLDEKELNLYLTKYGSWVKPLVDEIRKLRAENSQLRFQISLGKDSND